MDPDKQGWFPVIAIVAIAMLGLAVVMAFMPGRVESMRQTTHRAQLNSKMLTISGAMAMYASSNAGKLPDHVGRLITSGLVSGDAFLDPRNPSGVPPAYSGEARPGPVYRFGDIIVLYDPSHTLVGPGSTPAPAHSASAIASASTHSASAIFLTSVLDYDPDYRVMLMGVGYPTFVPLPAFAGFLAPDNANRKAAGLKEIDIKDVEALDKPLTPAP